MRGDEKMKLKIVLEPGEDRGFTVYVPSLPGCISEGTTREEALENIREAIALYLEPTEDDQINGERGEVLELAL
jgi:predicted RNase H-like HicB family nuclease